MSWSIRPADPAYHVHGRDNFATPIAINNPDWVQQRLPVSITKEQVKNSRDFDSEEPVTRQHETDSPATTAIRITGTQA